MNKWADHYTRKAQSEGLAARSYFKLEELDQRFGLLREGLGVLDLGCAPGSWLQYIAKKIGPKGEAWGVDLQPVALSLPAYVHVLQADVFSELEWSPVDLIVSDMAPSTSGDHGGDSARSAALVERALDLARMLLRPGGNLLAKYLEGSDMPALALRFRAGFSRFVRFRPKATRKHSTEVFLLGLGRTLE